MHGEYRGANYPEAYSDRDREEFYRRSVAAEQCYPNLFGPAGLHPTIDLTRDRDHMERRARYSNQSCAARRDMVRIDPDGSVHRCAIKGPSMGNLLQGTWQRATECAPCSRSYCVYFCEKYTALARDQMALAAAQ